MANPMRNWIDRFLGRGEAAVTVPPLDGALKPNNRLDDATVAIAVAAPDNLIPHGDGVIHSSGATLFRQPADGSAASAFATAGGPVSALAVGTDGTIAVAAASAITYLNAAGEAMSGLSAGGRDWSGVTAIAFAPDGALWITIGSAKNSLDDWQRDLLDGESAGSLWRLDPRTGEARQIAERLAYPNGVMAEADGAIIISEAWRKRLVRIGAGGQIRDQVMEDLPGYPARIGRSARGGYWLAIFAPRSPLIEFVLREPVYRKAMMAEVDKEFWIAPALRSGRSFREPMQGGALKQMGILKPWAPTRSYGLVVELGPDFVPLRSFHSRTGGKRHGVTSAAEAGGRLWVSSRGGDELVAIDLASEAN
jgi:hypothetical protein